jgi:hypothetical protein
MKNQKFKIPVMTRRAGGKHTEHHAGWLADVIAAVKVGTLGPKRHAIFYHGVPPHLQDPNEPPEPRPASAPLEPVDVPGADDQTRHVDPTPYPTAAGGSMKRQQNDFLARKP